MIPRSIPLGAARSGRTTVAPEGRNATRTIAEFGPPVIVGANVAVVADVWITYSETASMFDAVRPPPVQSAESVVNPEAGAEPLATPVPSSTPMPANTRHPAVDGVIATLGFAEACTAVCVVTSTVAVQPAQPETSRIFATTLDVKFAVTVSPDARATVMTDAHNSPCTPDVPDPFTAAAPVNLAYVFDFVSVTDVITPPAGSDETHANIVDPIAAVVPTVALVTAVVLALLLPVMLPNSRVMVIRYLPMLPRTSPWR